MKLKNYIVLALLATFLTTYAQVGIGTVTPDGALDLNSDEEKSGSAPNKYGLVLPRVVLSRTDVAAPVVNPVPPGDLAIGTVVYNTATTSQGVFSVYPGIYMWDGVNWINEFQKRDARIYKQFEVTGGGPWLRTMTAGSYQDIPNMVGRTFTPAYSGTYKIELSVNFGSGKVLDAGSSTDMGVQKGNFRFTFDAADEFIPAQSWSTVNGSGSSYFLIWEQTTVVYYKDLVAGTPYTFSLSFDQTDSNGFDNDGDSVDGMGWIGRDLPCSVEFIYLN